MSIELPSYMKDRPEWGGYRVPFFVAWYLNGHQVPERTPGSAPSFPVTDASKNALCRRRNVCWICGHQMGAFKSFVFGPLSAMQKLSLEPPSHRACAEYAVQVCPFIVNPSAVHGSTKPGNKTRVLHDTEIVKDVTTVHPEVCVVYTTKSYGCEMKDPSRGIALYKLHDPETITFWLRGKPATYKEIVDAVQASIARGSLAKHMSATEIAWRVKGLLSYAGEPT